MPLSIQILLWAVAISQIAIALGFFAIASALRGIAKDLW